MDKNIKVHIKDRVAVAEGDPVIICGNSDYTVTFTFDEEWGNAYAKTARFNFRTFDGPAHIDQPFTGDTVEVPELSNVREVEVGVFVGDLNTTTGASIRCKPCIRCGSGAPKDPTPDVYDKIMELIKRGGGGSGGGGETLDGLPVYVVDTLPEDPEVGDIVALNTTRVRPWNEVKVWSRDEVPYQEGGAAVMCEDLPLEGNFVAGAVPDVLDLSGMNTDGYIACGVILQGSNGRIGITIDNFRTGDKSDVYAIVQDHYKNIIYLFNKGAWKASQDGSNPADISAQDIKLPSLSDVVVLDYFCTMTDDEFFEYESIGNIEPDPALSILPQLGAITHEAGLYIAEELSGGPVWQRTDRKTAKQFASLNTQLAKSTTGAATALKQADKALSEALLAQNQIEPVKTRLSTAEQNVKRALDVAASASSSYNYLGPKVDENTVKANTAIKQAETNAGAIAELQEAVNGYSAFLEEINGEVVDDE